MYDHLDKPYCLFLRCPDGRNPYFQYIVCVICIVTTVTIVAPGPVSRLQNDSITDVCVTLSWSFGFNGNAPITGVYITYTATSNYGMSQGAW